MGSDSEGRGSEGGNGPFSSTWKGEATQRVRLPEKRPGHRGSRDSRGRDSAKIPIGKQERQKNRNSRANPRSRQGCYGGRSRQGDCDFNRQANSRKAHLRRGCPLCRRAPSACSDPLNKVQRLSIAGRSGAAERVPSTWAHCSGRCAIVAGTFISRIESSGSLRGSNKWPSSKS